mmetsp:Transcript_62009/g.145440  ORF Transcript_62009/g.145440 Transcript_62009/m.145440 type:complete len:308 (-) Transcript_62009:1064-1987(-)
MIAAVGAQLGCTAEPPARASVLAAVIALQFHGLGLQLELSNLDQLWAGVVFEGEGERHARAEAGVRVEEVIHLLRVAGQNHDEMCTVVFHLLDERIHSFDTETVSAALDQCVSLIDEEDASHSLLHDRLHLQSRRTDVLSHEIGSGGLLEFEALIRVVVLRGDCAHGQKQLAHQTGNHRLSSSGIAQEAHVQTLPGEAAEALFFSHLSELDEIEQVPHGIFDLSQPNEVEEFRLELLHRPTRSEGRAGFRQVPHSKEVGVRIPRGFFGGQLEAVLLTVGPVSVWKRLIDGVEVVRHFVDQSGDALIL